MWKSITNNPIQIIMELILWIITFYFAANGQFLLIANSWKNALNILKRQQSYNCPTAVKNKTVAFAINSKHLHSPVYLENLLKRRVASSMKIPLGANRYSCSFWRTGTGSAVVATTFRSARPRLGTVPRGRTPSWRAARQTMPKLQWLHPGMYSRPAFLFQQACVYLHIWA